MSMRNGAKLGGALDQIQHVRDVELKVAAGGERHPSVHLGLCSASRT